MYKIMYKPKWIKQKLTNEFDEKFNWLKPKSEESVTPLPKAHLLDFIQITFPPQPKSGSEEDDESQNSDS